MTNSMTNCQSIMVVDDQPLIGKMITRFLGKHNYEALFFTSGKEALAYLSAKGGSASGGKTNEAVGLLLTDIDMPEIHGIELARQVKTLYPALPIIVMSGSADGQDRDEIFKLGADFIPKPFQLVDLLKQVDRLLIGCGPRWPSGPGCVRGAPFHRSGRT